MKINKIPCFLLFCTLIPLYGVDADDDQDVQSATYTQSRLSEIIIRMPPPIIPDPDCTKFRALLQELLPSASVPNILQQNQDREVLEQNRLGWNTNYTNSLKKQMLWFLDQHFASLHVYYPCIKEDPIWNVVTMNENTVFWNQLKALLSLRICGFSMLAITPPQLLNEETLLGKKVEINAAMRRYLGEWLELLLPKSPVGDLYYLIPHVIPNPVGNYYVYIVAARAHLQNNILGLFASSQESVRSFLV